jgi:hypothetical protein
MAKLGLYTADDFQIVKLALALRATNVACCKRCPLDAKPGDKGYEGMRLMKCILMHGSDYIGDVVQDFDGEVTTILDDGKMTPSIMLNSVRYIRDAMLEMKIEKFWPVCLANHFVTYIDSFTSMQVRMVNDISFMKGGIWRALYHRLSYDFIKEHPITMQGIERTIEKLKKRSSSMEGKADPFTTERRKTLCKRLHECTELTSEMREAAAAAYDRARKSDFMFSMSQYSILFKKKLLESLKNVMFYEDLSFVKKMMGSHLMQDSMTYGAALCEPTKVYMESSACDGAIEAARMIYEDREWMDLRYVLDVLDYLVA